MITGGEKDKKKRVKVINMLFAYATYFRGCPLEAVAKRPSALLRLYLFFSFLRSAFSRVIHCVPTRFRPKLNYICGDNIKCFSAKLELGGVERTSCDAHLCSICVVC